MASPNDSTRDLLNGYLSGNRQAECELFEQHRERLLQRVQREHWMAGLSKYASPEDLVGEVFVRALSSGLLLDFTSRGSGSLSKLLFKLLDNVAVDTYRRHGAGKRGGGRMPASYDAGDEGAKTGHGAPAVASMDTTPTSKVRAGELLERCRAALEPREWEIWHMAEVEGFDSLEIAERLNTTDSAARGVLRRARNKLLTKLTEFVCTDPGIADQEDRSGT